MPFSASTLLKSQGWLGTGHALDARLPEYESTSQAQYNQKGKKGLKSSLDSDKISGSNDIVSGNGLTKPLLISQRGESKRGLGKKSHEPVVGNDWWLKGFSAALDNIGKGTTATDSERSGTSTPTITTTTGAGSLQENVNRQNGRYGGLYGYFTTGQMMKGSLEEQGIEERLRKKRKSDQLDTDTKANNHVNEGKEVDDLAVKPVKRAATAGELESSVAYLAARDLDRIKKNEKRQKRNLDKSAKDDFAKTAEFMGELERAAKKDKKNKNTDRDLRSGLDMTATISDTSANESKPEDDVRSKKKRRKEKEHDRLLELMVADAEKELSSMEDTSMSSSTETKSRRKRDKKIKESGIRVFSEQINTQPGPTDRQENSSTLAPVAERRKKQAIQESALSKKPDEVISVPHVGVKSAQPARPMATSAAVQPGKIPSTDVPISAIHPSRLRMLGLMV